jgi:hypothetical protein
MLLQTTSRHKSREAMSGEAYGDGDHDLSSAESSAAAGARKLIEDIRFYSKTPKTRKKYSKILLTLYDYVQHMAELSPSKGYGRYLKLLDSETRKNVDEYTGVQIFNDYPPLPEELLLGFYHHRSCNSMKDPKGKKARYAEGKSMVVDGARPIIIHGARPIIIHGARPIIMGRVP